MILIFRKGWLGTGLGHIGHTKGITKAVVNFWLRKEFQKKEPFQLQGKQKALSLPQWKGLYPQAV